MRQRRPETEDPRNGGSVVRRDAGVSFIEILVAIVLLGTAMIAVLTAVRTTVIGTRLERDHARAQVWLQSAAEALQATPRVGCDPVGSPATVPDVRAIYETEVRTLVASPPGWDPSSQLSVIDVRFWDGSSYQAQCFDNAGFRLQLVTMRVLSADGDILEELSVVKDTPDVVVP
jgi:hypothetical protein